MPWNLQPTRLTARLFSASKSFAERDPPDVIAQVDLTADGKAYVHATMSRIDGGTPAGAWRDLVRLLRSAWGVTSVEWDHKRKASTIDPARAWADTVAVD